jgi:hypothetical protein
MKVDKRMLRFRKYTDVWRDRREGDSPRTRLARYADAALWIDFDRPINHAERAAWRDATLR